MARKLSVTALIVLLGLLISFIPVQAEKSYFAERFDVLIDIQDDGSAIITETVDFHFEGEPFTYAFREISGDETDGITFLEASMDGVPMLQGARAGQVEVEAGDPLKVTWHFSPTYGSTHTFTVRYQADGVIRRDGSDTLIWRAIPEDHDYPIDKSTIILTYPEEAAMVEQPTLDWNHDAKWEDGRLILTASGIAEDEDLVVTAHFPAGSLIQAPPDWQVLKERADAAMTQALPLGISAGIALLILGGLGLFWIIRANGRELNLGPVVPRANPPSDLPPAIVGKLTRQSHTSMGAIFDLAERGVLEVEEEKGHWSTKQHMLVRHAPDTSLMPYEQGLLDALYTTGKTRIPMSEVPTRLAMKSRMFEEPLEQELVRRGWLDLERKHKQTWLSGSGILLLSLSLIVFILSLVGGGLSFSSNLAWLPFVATVTGTSVALFILSIPLLVYAATFSTLTPTGEQQAILWKGFGEYLKRVSTGREPVVRPDYFEKYLAYAATFGLGKKWASHFQDLGGVRIPVWFHAMDGTDGDFGAMIAVMAASDTAGSTGGGGGGASGGGSSGAG